MRKDISASRRVIAQPDLNCAPPRRRRPALAPGSLAVPLPLAESGLAPWPIAGALLLALLTLLACGAAAEAALFALNSRHVRECAVSPRRSLRRVAALLQSPEPARSVLLLFNSAAATTLMAVAVAVLPDVAAAAGVAGAIAFAAFTVVAGSFVGHMLPASLGARLSSRCAPAAAAGVAALAVVLRPVTRLLTAALVDPLARSLAPGGTAQARDLTPDELRALLNLSTRDGVVHQLESAFIQEIADLGRVKVREVMVPRVDVKAYNVNATPDGLRDLMRRTRLKKIPVFRGAIDDVVGLVYAKLLFLERDKPLRDLVLPVRFVPEAATCEQLLRFFRETRSQLAIVVDEYGGMAGLVTLEDLLEEIVGDIRDPEDAPPAPEIVPVSDVEYELSGRLSVRFWPEFLGLPNLDPKATTVSGLMTSCLGRSPRVGDVARFGNIELAALRVHRHRIDRLRLRLVTEARG